MPETRTDTETEPGLLDGIKFWARLLTEGVAILAGSLLAFFVVRPAYTYATGDAGTALAATWLLATVGVMIWYKRRRRRIGY